MEAQCKCKICGKKYSSWIHAVNHVKLYHLTQSTEDNYYMYIHILRGEGGEEL